MKRKKERVISAINSHEWYFPVHSRSFLVKSWKHAYCNISHLLKILFALIQSQLILFTDETYHSLHFLYAFKENEWDISLIGINYYSVLVLSFIFYMIRIFWQNGMRLNGKNIFYKSQPVLKNGMTIDKNSISLMLVRVQN
jgi:hypothetical protein